MEVVSLEVARGIIEVSSEAKTAAPERPSERLVVPGAIRFLASNGAPLPAHCVRVTLRLVHYGLYGRRSRAVCQMSLCDVHEGLFAALRSSRSVTCRPPDGATHSKTSS